MTRRHHCFYFPPTSPPPLPPKDGRNQSQISLEGLKHVEVKIKPAGKHHRLLLNERLAAV